jgi:hypothetical protein
MYNLLAVSGLLDQLQTIKPRPATVEELTRHALGLTQCEV